MFFNDNLVFKSNGVTMKLHEIFSNTFNEWDELEKKITTLNDNIIIGEVFEQFVYLYFELHKNMYNIREVYREKDIPKELKERLKLEPSDYGVDGVIVTEDDKLIAYQAKFRSNRNQPTYSELSTFWAESEYADMRCIVSNCYELPLQSGKKKVQFSILYESLSNLDEVYFENMRLIYQGYEVIITDKFKPFPHQTKIINEVLEGFLSSNRGKLIAACGTGKTLTSLWILEKLQPQTAIFVVPNLSLIKQTLEQWIEQATSPFRYLCVCSDSSVINPDNYDNLAHSVANLNFPVTTNADFIKDFLEHNCDKLKIVFSTYQSLDAIMNAISAMSEFKFDLGIFDEAHRTAGTKDTSLFTYGMNDDYIPIKKRLFMTATERVVSPRIKKNIEETVYEVFSMDDEALYGKTFSALNFGEAIEQKIISDYQIVLCCINNAEISEMIDKNLYVTSMESGVTTSENLFLQVLLAKCFDQLAVSKVITFHNKVENSQNFIYGDDRSAISIKSVFNSVFKEMNTSQFYADHVDGSMSAAKRHKIIKAFETYPNAVISNARCLTEGVDVPIIDAVYFASPKNSIIDIIQAVGRALRKSEEKENEYSYIIIPIIIPENVTNFDEVDANAFDTLHCVVQALRDQDKAFSEVIDELNLSAAMTGRTKLGKNGNLNDKIKIFLPPQIDFNSFSENLSLRIATVNKDPQNAKSSFVIDSGVKARQSGVKRIFRTIGDYTQEAFNTLIIPTLQKFNRDDERILISKLKINHNNVSHTEKLGIIEKNGKLYNLTEIGKHLFHDQNLFDFIFKEQLLKYYEVDQNSNQILFPYRNLLRIFLYFDSISRFEFLYAVYSIFGSSSDYIQEAVERINYLRDTYSNIDILSSENKSKVLDLINAKFDVNFNFNDIWTSRTTAYNQFNYFKNHLFCFDNVIDVNASKKNSICKIQDKESEIEKMLISTEMIELCSLKDLHSAYCSFIG